MFSWEKKTANAPLNICVCFSVQNKLGTIYNHIFIWWFPYSYPYFKVILSKWSRTFPYFQQFCRVQKFNSWFVVMGIARSTKIVSIKSKPTLVETSANCITAHTYTRNHAYSINKTLYIIQSNLVISKFSGPSKKVEISGSWSLKVSHLNRILIPIMSISVIARICEG